MLRSLLNNYIKELILLFKKNIKKLKISLKRATEELNLS